MTDSLIKAFDYSRRLGRYVYAYEAYGSNWNIIASNKPGYRYALTISPLTGESIHIQLYDNNVCLCDHPNYIVPDKLIEDIFIKAI
jgi:hypothetical protein